MDKQTIDKRLVDLYLTDAEGLARLYREGQEHFGRSDIKDEDALPESNERVLMLAREVGAKIQSRHRRRFYIPAALAASAILAVVAIKLVPITRNDVPDVYLLGSEGPAQQVARIQELIKQGRKEEAIAAITKLREKYPNYPLPVELQPTPGK